MKKITVLFILLSTLLFSCSRQEFDARTTAEINAKKGGSITNLLPGVCPYDCHDTRCKAYLNGYCGPVTESVDTLKVLANSNNPEEAAGIAHNNTLYAVMPPYNYTTVQPSDAEIFTKTKAYLLTLHYDSTILNGTYNYIMTTWGSYRNIPDINTQATNLYNNHTITLDAKNYLNTLYTKANAFGKSVDTLFPTQASYNSFANSLITIENQIKNSTTLTTNDKYILEGAYSVARYSVIYHMNYMIKNDTYNSGVVSKNSFQKPKSPGSWFSDNEAFNWDIAGSVGGAAGALISGFFTGGWSWTLIGQATAIGGTGASFSDAAYQIAHHYNP